MKFVYAINIGRRMKYLRIFGGFDPQFMPKMVGDLLCVIPGGTFFRLSTLLSMEVWGVAMARQRLRSANPNSSVH